MFNVILQFFGKLLCVLVHCAKCDDHKMKVHPRVHAHKKSGHARCLHATQKMVTTHLLKKNSCIAQFSSLLFVYLMLKSSIVKKITSLFNQRIDFFFIKHHSYCATNQNKCMEYLVSTILISK